MPDRDCEQPSKPCLVGRSLGEIQGTLTRVEAHLERIDSIQRTQADQLHSLDVRAKRAAESAEEAKRMADAAQVHVDRVLNSIRTYTDAVGKTLQTQGETLRNAVDTLSTHGRMLEEQTAAMREQTEALRQLSEAELRRSTRETLIANMQKESRDWVRWSVPLALTLLLTLVGVVSWAVTHAQPPAPAALAPPR